MVKDWFHIVQHCQMILCAVNEHNIGCVALWGIDIKFYVPSVVERASQILELADSTQTD